MGENRKINSSPIGVRVKNSCFHKIGVYLFLCSFLFCFVQCKNSPQEVFQAKGGLRVLIGLDSASYTSPNDGPAAIRKQVMDALSNRIQSYGVVPYMEWQEENNCLLMEIPGVKEPERVLHLLQRDANLEFWEVFDLTEIYSQLVEVDEYLAGVLVSTSESSVNSLSDKEETSLLESSEGISGLDSLLAQLDEASLDATRENELFVEEFAKQHPLFAKLRISMYETQQGGLSLIPGPVVGYVQKDELKQVMGYLSRSDIRSILPASLVFKWGVNPMDEHWYELYALKKTNRQGAALHGNVVTEAKAEWDSYGEGYSIHLRMNQEGAAVWSLLTKENIGRNLAMVIDDKVYSAPRVNDQITGGRSMISGDFTKEEARDLANALSSGKTPVPIVILRHEMVEPVAELASPL